MRLCDRCYRAQPRCEICDRPILSYSAWIVPHRRRAPWGHWKFEPDKVLPKSYYRVVTCGDEVCKFRAAHHGVPGQAYT